MRLLLTLLAATAVLAVDVEKCEDYRYLQSVSSMGCTMSVWRAGQRLLVEPSFCVPRSQHWLTTDDGPCQNFDPVGRYSYVNVPVMLTNRTLLEDVAAQLSHLKPASVRYFGLTEARVIQRAAIPTELQFRPRDFIWSGQAEETVGLLRLGCDAGIVCSVLANMLREGRWEPLEPLVAVATMKPPCGKPIQAKAPIAVQGSAYASLQHLERLARLSPRCQNITGVTVLDVTIGGANCRLRFHRDRRGEGGPAILHAEPLLCYTGGARVQYDFNRRRHYISLTILLRNEAALASAEARLGSVSSVTFMRLLDPGLAVVQGHELSTEVLLQADEKSLLMRVPCESQTACSDLRSAMESDPLVIFSRIKWRPVSWLQQGAAASDGCRYEAAEARLPVPLTLSAGPAAGCPAVVGMALTATLAAPPRRSCGAVRCRFVRLPDGRGFLVAQQRLSASVRFDRNWTDYEVGFGDEHNFWIGLRNMASLTQPGGSLLRIEARLWNGSELHAEYSSLRLLGDRYNLTYGQYLRHRSSTGPVDLLASSRNAAFSTRDAISHSVMLNAWNARYHQYMYTRTLRHVGDAGWWWVSSLVDFNPNGVFHYGETMPASTDRQTYVGLNLTSAECGGGGRPDWRALKEVRLMLEV